jgi:AraC-like DNA-binding protein
VVGFILQRRMARARQLPAHPGHTCAEEAFACGFGSVQPFTWIFRRFEVMSRLEWRRQVPDNVPAERTWSAAGPAAIRTTEKTRRW